MENAKAKGKKIGRATITINTTKQATAQGQQLFYLKRLNIQEEVA